jgi:hypothetical protein
MHNHDLSNNLKLYLDLPKTPTKYYKETDCPPSSGGKFGHTFCKGDK